MEIDKEALGPGYDEWCEEIERIKRAVVRCGERDLEVLAGAGVERNVLLELLALAAHGDSASLLHEMRRQRDYLKSLSERLQAICRETEQLVDSPLASIRFWSRYAGFDGVLGSPDPEPLKADPGIALSTSAIQLLAKRLESEAGRFGRYLRSYTRTDRGIVILVARCWILRVTKGGAKHLARGRGRTRLSLDYLKELARLLTDAFEAAGKNCTFSADGLRQTFKRHGRRLVVRWVDAMLMREKSNLQSAGLSCPGAQRQGRANFQ